jgi:ribosomal protein S14
VFGAEIEFAAVPQRGYFYCSQCGKPETSSFNALESREREISKRLIYSLSKNFRNFTSKEFTDVFGAEIEFAAVPQRGYSYCSQCGKPETSLFDNIGTKFQVQFKYNPSSQHYEIVTKQTCRQHDHPLAGEQDLITSWRMIDGQSLMHAEDIQ